MKGAAARTLAPWRRRARHDGVPGGPADPVARHVAALEAALHGPARTRARMMREVRDGLTDAAADLAPRTGPAAEREAARQAVRDFGTVAEVRPAFQRELTLAQARQTARLVACTVPVLFACWLALGALAPYGAGGSVHGFAGLLAVPVAGVALAAATATALAAAALFVTGAGGRRIPTPSRLPVLVAGAATTASAALAAGAFALSAVAVQAGDGGTVAVVGALTLVSHVKVGSSARACRRCARLAHAGSAGGE